MLSGLPELDLALKKVNLRFKREGIDITQGSDKDLVLENAGGAESVESFLEQFRTESPIAEREDKEE